MFMVLHRLIGVNWRLLAAVRRRAGRAVRDQAGFTLVEILVVLTIMSLIMSLIGPRVLGYLAEAKHKAARIQVDSLSSAVELFYLDNGRYPLESEGLQALVAAPASLRTWNGPYVKSAAVPLDPWGKPYLYVSKDRGRSYTISFAGVEARPEAAPKPGVPSREAANRP